MVSLYKLVLIEIKRLSVSRLAWLLAMAVLLTPLPGLNLPVFCQTISSNTLLILSPAKVSALLAGILFAVFTVYELDRMPRFNMDSIIESGVEVLKFNVAKVIAILVCALLVLLAAGLLYLPYTFFRMKAIFDLPLYLSTYGLITLPSVIFSVLLSAGVYLIFWRMDASFLIFSGLIFFSLNSESNYLLSWMQTNISGYSDYFGNSFSLRLVVWNRLFWLFLSLAVFFVGLLTLRRYEKGIFYSVLINLKKVILPAGLLLFTLVAFLLYSYEPYFDNTPYPEIQEIVDKESNTVMAVMVTEKPDANELVRLVDTQAEINLYPEKASLSSKVLYSLENISGMDQKVLFELQPGYLIFSIKMNGTPVSWTIPEEGQVEVVIPKDEEISMEVLFEGKVQNSRLFQRHFAGLTVISREYVNLMGKSLLPLLNVDTAANIISGQITAPASLMVLTTGSTEKISGNPEDSRGVWAFTSTWRSLQLIAADFVVEHIQAGGLEIEFYYARGQVELMREMKAGEIIQKSVDYFSNIIGSLDYVDVPLKIVENTISMQGGNASGNISNIGESIFNKDLFMISDLEGSDNIEVLVHEIAHQWWGISTNFEFDPPWTAEGLTVFSTYKFLASEYGSVFAEKTNVEKWRQYYKEMKRDFYYRNPEYLEIIPPAYQYSIVSGYNATVMYSQMPLEILRAEQILGEEKFLSVLSKVFRRYKNQFGFEDFLNECGLNREMISYE